MSNAFDEEYKKYNDDLVLWEQSLCLSFKEPDRGKIEKILELTIEQIREAETMLLCEYSFVLSQYLIFLQKKSNECECYLKWTKNVIGKLFNEDKSKAGRLSQKVELRLSRIIYLSRRVEFYCQTIQTIIRQRNLEIKNG
jgi:hypothetical protein